MHIDNSIAFSLCAGSIVVGFPSYGVAFRRGSLLRIGFIAVVSFSYFVRPVAAWYGSVSGGG